MQTLCLLTFFSSYVFAEISADDNGSVTFTLERKPEHQQEKPVFVIEEQGRDRWSRKIEFLFACIGFCVGYGNMWRFPYMCFKNGGGEYIAKILVSCGISWSDF